MPETRKWHPSDARDGRCVNMKEFRGAGNETGDALVYARRVHIIV